MINSNVNIHALIADINSAVEWWADYQEDDQAGVDNVPLDCIADAMALRQNEIRKVLHELASDCGVELDQGDIERLENDILHFHIESKTDHIFSSFDYDNLIYIDGWPIQEHHQQYTIDEHCYGRITEARLKVIENHIDAIVSGYNTTPGNTVLDIELCWPTDAIWTFYVDKEAVKQRILEDYTNDEDDQ